MAQQVIVVAGRVFVAAPTHVCKEHLVCAHNGRLSAVDSFCSAGHVVLAKYKTIQGALDFARRIGARRPAVI